MRNYTPYACMPIAETLEIAAAMGPAEFKIWVVCWAKAVELRTEILPAEFNVHELAKAADLSVKTARRWWTKCPRAVDKMSTCGGQNVPAPWTKCPIQITPDNLIKVNGVRGYHGKLRGWDGAGISPDAGNQFPLSVKRVKELRVKNSIIPEKRTQKPGNIPGIPVISYPMKSRGGVKKLGDSKIFQPMAIDKLRMIAMAKMKQVGFEDLCLCIDERTPADVANSAIEICERNVLDLLEVVYKAKQGANPAALFTSLIRAVKSGKPVSGNDNCERYKQRQASTLPVKREAK